VAWPESSVPLESDGESVLLCVLDELPVVVEPLSVVAVEPFSVLVVVVASVESAAWAAMPTASVPAMLAAASTPVIAVVRRSPLFRSIDRLPHLLTTQ
jgi:hypothetical protein